VETNAAGTAAEGNHGEELEQLIDDAVVMRESHVAPSTVGTTRELPMCIAGVGTLIRGTVG
jgi:hypothetical protein